MIIIHFFCKQNTVHLGYNAVDGTNIKPHYNRGRSITEVRFGRLDVYGVLVGLEQKSHYNRDRSISEGTITEVDCIISLNLLQRMLILIYSSAKLRIVTNFEVIANNLITLLG